MCNLSDGIEERAEERATERTEKTIVLNMYENDFSLEQISLATKKSIEEIERIIEKNEPVLVQAIKKAIGQDKSIRAHIIKKFDDETEVWRN